MMRNIFHFSLGLFFTAATVWADQPIVPAGTAASSVPAGSATAAGGAAAQQPGFMGMVLPFVLMFGVLYFLMIRPQQKKMKEHQRLLSEIKKGDEVLTNSGFLGKVTGMTEKVVTLELATNVRVKMMKSQVSQVVKGQV